MPRGFHIAIQETRNAPFLDPRSFVGFKASKPAEFHALLYGDDKVAMRKHVFIRDKCRCQNCGVPVTWESGELDHVKGGSSDRCDCSSNLRVLCGRCHRQRHVSVKWTRHEMRNEPSGHSQI